MRIYIGTEGETARRAFEIGLAAPLPCPAAKDYPAGFFPGHPEAGAEAALELSTVYAPDQAATSVGPDRRWGIVEIETQDLDPTRLAPTTTWLSGFLAAHQGASWVEPTGLRAADGVEGLGAHPSLLRGLWRASVEATGRCRYDGAIPPHAVCRVALFDPLSNEDLTQAPSGVEDHHHLEASQRALTEWFFAPIDPSRMLDPVERALVMGDDALGPLPDAYWIVQESARDQLFWWQTVLARRDGLTVLTRANA